MGADCKKGLTCVDGPLADGGTGLFCAKFCRTDGDCDMGWRCYINLDVGGSELPQVCAHFVIDRDGTIYELVPPNIMCRHTVGLNWTAIGIEHVGYSDGEILRNRRQLAASLRLRPSRAAQRSRPAARPSPVT